MKICYEQRPDALALAENKLELRFPSGTTWIASRYDDGSLAGVAVFTSVAKGNCFLHVASQSSRWFSPAFCQAMFHHPFVTLGCRRLTASIAADNSACLRLARHVGFREEGYLRGFDFGDLVMFGMLKEECKWAGL